MTPMNVKLKSFSLFFKAFVKTRHEMWVSVQVLFFITIVLSIILCMAESDDLSNWWNSLIWSFMQYIEDPGEFADFKPVTFVGRIIAVLIAFPNFSLQRYTFSGRLFTIFIKFAKKNISLQRNIVLLHI